MSGDFAKLDPVGAAAARRDAVVELVTGLAGPGSCPFATADGTCLRHRGFHLKPDPYQESDPYRADSAFRPVYRVA